MTINKIYLDMDGVLCDFHKRYQELYGVEAAGEDRDRKNFSKNWKHFIATEQFATLDWFPGGKELLAFVSALPVRLEILSSTGGIPFHTEVRDQKETWLASNEIYLPGNFVPGRKVKQYYSFPGNVLIDDTPDVIGAFNRKTGGAGVGILHKDVNKTIARLKELLK